MRSVIVMLKQKESSQRRDEVLRLAENANYEVLNIFIQNSKPRPKFLIGEGKVREISDYILENNIELVIFENYLSSRQIMLLEKEFKVPVIDKFDLILNVFEMHARSKEAKLQIELARLKRKLPYIKMVISEKVRREHPGFGSSGEYIIHSTISSIHKRIKKIERELQRFELRQKEQSKRRREKGKVVSLVGYTNVGKTTILNSLTKANKKARDEFFTTLKTKTSFFVFKKNKFFLNDTIGFIRNLPHELIYAFRATLGEIKNSDLLLLVLDSSEPEKEFLRKKEVCEQTLIRIGADGIPRIYVLNKIDLCDKKELEKKTKLVKPYVAISAKYGIGYEELKNEIYERA
ncbi:MAG: GTPase HflX [Candidatus Hydrothermarchaeota archaeon]|nr:MAG: GTPase HflX [Candidatus Hydrothermarchaeota archaeon]